MATSQSLPSPNSAPPKPPESAETPEAVAEQALVPSPQSLDNGAGMNVPPPVAQLPVEVDVALPIRDFRVRNLLALEPGQIIETLWAQGEDMPLAAGDVQLAWSEFEVVDSQLAVRVTRLA
jgi:flagellar motor switch/type III secretory pathway protein FliN